MLTWFFHCSKWFFSCSSLCNFSPLTVKESKQLVPGPIMPFTIHWLSPSNQHDITHWVCVPAQLLFIIVYKHLQLCCSMGDRRIKDTACVHMHFCYDDVGVRILWYNTLNPRSWNPGYAKQQQLGPWASLLTGKYLIASCPDCMSLWKSGIFIIMLI